MALGMRALQGSHDFTYLALHMQHDYLPKRGRISFQNVQFVKRISAMAAVETTRPAPFGAITTYRAINGVGNFFSMISAWNDARVTRNALDKLSDRELDDIGLSRSDIYVMGR
jgi:uncharacterized protein YjiS (DUF1127 family)